jgi:hypothetical protein
MDIKNTMCKVSELSQWEIDSLIDAMPNDGFIGPECFMGVNVNGKWGNFAGGYSPKIVSYDEMMQLLTGKSMKEFTKSDLKTGMFVKFRRGDYRIVLGDCALDAVSRCCLLNLKDNLLAANDMLDSIDIMSVYNINAHTSITDHLNGKNLTLIWERTELTPAQQEMEVLQAKMDEFQAQMEQVQEQMKVAKAKLYLQGDWGE